MSEQRIGKYVIQSELGRGAMGVVYKAVDPVIGRTVAIKTVRFDLLSDPGQRDEAQRRFEREAQSAGSLSHPNIATIYDIGEADGTTFIAMEFVEGQSLESLLAQGVRWDTVNAARFGVQMAEALDLAHRKGIVHRDIKPGNILVDQEGRPHIVDFGIARIASSTMTQTNMVMGTPFYMSPEQIAGRKVDHRSDIFALGAVLYEMLTREKAFPGESLTTVIYKIMNEAPVPVATVRSDIPSGISRLVLKALEKDPEARYGSCREMIADLRPFLSGQEFPGPEPAPAETTAVPAAKKGRLKKSKERPAAAVAAASSAGTTVYASAPKDLPVPGGPGESAPLEKHRKKLLLVVALMMLIIVAVGGLLYFSFLKPAPEAVPPGGAFSVVIADKAVSENSAAAAVPPPDNQALTGLETETGAGTPPDGLKTDPETKAKETPGKTEVPVEKKSDESAKADDPSVLLVPSKEEPVKTEPAAKKSGTRLPRLIRQVDPVYPEDALRERIEADVTLNLTVGFNGRVERAVVVKSVPKLDAAAVAAARKWEFEPGLLEGIPIQATLQVTIHFTPPAGAAPPKTGEEAEKPDPSVPAKTKPVESLPSDDVSRARDLLERGSRAESLALARKVLAAHPNSTEAKAVALDAVIQLAPGEIKNLVDEYAASYKTGRPAEFFRLHARPDVYNRLRGDLEIMMSAAREIQVTAANLNLDFQMARYPEFQTRAVFSQVMTGIPASKLYREVMFEGRYSWILERRENDWLIVSVKVE